MILGTATALGVSRRTGDPPTPAAPVNTVAPSISGLAQVGETLTADLGLWTGYPEIAYARQWRNGGVNISGATGAAYTLQPSDYASNVDCVVIATNTEGSASATAAAVAVTGVAPLISGVPDISGTPEVGQVLTASAAGVSGYPAPTRAWQWLRDGVSIAGATNSTYTLVTADGGTDVSAEQTETNALGFDAAVSSSVPVAGPPPSLYVDAGYVDTNYVMEA